MIVHERDVRIGTERYKDGTGVIYLQVGDVRLDLEPRSVPAIAGMLVTACRWFVGNKFRDD